MVWTLTRSTIFNKLKIPKFFQQATTYDEYYMNDFLEDIECYKKSNKDKAQRSDYLIGFNGTGTKVMIIEQPIVPLISISPNEFSSDKALDMLSSTFGMTIDQIKNIHINFQMIAQQQTIILNQIRKKRDKFKKSYAVGNQETEVN